MILAGEESGVLYAQEIAAKLSGCEFRGYRDYGFETIDLAVMGFWPVIRRLFFFLRVRRTMKRAIREWRPDTVLTIDYPGMNLALAAYAKSLGIRTVHVVSPQVWAWKKWKIPTIERSLDRLCCFFPFEPRYFREGLATFVGHPLFDAFQSSNLQTLKPSNSQTLKPSNLSSNHSTVQPFNRSTEPSNSQTFKPSNFQTLKPSNSTLAVLPGSRAGEIERILPVLIEAVVELRKEHPELEVVVPAANPRARRLIEEVIARSASARVAVIDGGARELLLRSRCAVVASGTATLEAALARCPTVLVYRVGPITALILRALITGTRFAGLANIIWDKCGGKGEQPMTELLQEAFTVGSVVANLRPLLEDDAAHSAAVARLDSAMALLASDGGAIARIAAEV